MVDIITKEVLCDLSIYRSVFFCFVFVIAFLFSSSFFVAFSLSYVCVWGGRGCGGGGGGDFVC